MIFMKRCFAGVVFLCSGVSTEGIPNGEKCRPTDICKGNNATCRDGFCECMDGLYYQYAELSGDCKGYAQIRRILTTDDHPWMILNQTCLSSKKMSALSCRHSPCYTGLLIDILRTIDLEYHNLENCTIQGIETFGNFTNTGRRMITRNDTARLMDRWDADLALVIMNDRNSQNHARIDALSYAKSLGYRKRSYIDIEFILGIEDLGSKKIMSTLIEKWFVKNKELWTKKKQRTNFTPLQECLYKTD
ncbi:uncharacterized protein LOC118437215 isoform X2 [Folsomia candida]|uniref:uncharacterized protein LOC118437215 isoform X2 n=1 Tax=Folsomia candida TaxID=158441 RepID=UPI0016055C48|nr:uncharacterized protein LOC118437215 isoform X2 [Folsomia candida]